MKTSSYYPVLMTSRVAETAAFYQQFFAFQPQFESDWYVHLQSADDDQVTLAILDGSHDSVPASARGREASGLLLNFEVSDVDAVHERLAAQGLPIIQALRSEDFGQRHFIAVDPNGVLIDVIEPIAPTAEFAAQFAPSALPG